MILSLTSWVLRIWSHLEPLLTHETAITASILQEKKKTKILRRRIIYWPSHSNEHEMPRCLTINLGSAFSSVNPFRMIGGGACSFSHSVCPLAGFPGLQKACQLGRK